MADQWTSPDNLAAAELISPRLQRPRLLSYTVLPLLKPRVHIWSMNWGDWTPLSVLPSVVTLIKFSFSGFQYYPPFSSIAYGTMAKPSLLGMEELRLFPPTLVTWLPTEPSLGTRLGPNQPTQEDLHFVVVLLLWR